MLVVVVFFSKLNCKKTSFGQTLVQPAGSVRRFVSFKSCSIMSRQFDVSKRKLNEQLKDKKMC